MAPDNHALAILVGRVDYGESDVIVQLFTDGIGRVSALARSARRSQKRFGGALEPFHTLSVSLGARARGDLLILKDASIHKPRLRLTESLERLEAAAEGLAWLKKTTLPTSPERALFERTEAFLDALTGGKHPPRSELSAFGLDLMESLGFGLNFHACVSCGKGCPPGRPAWIHPARGGLICVECGGGPIRLSSELRDRLAKRGGSHSAAGESLSESDEALLLKVVQRALSVHMGLEHAP